MTFAADIHGPQRLTQKALVSFHSLTKPELWPNTLFYGQMFA